MICRKDIGLALSDSTAAFHLHSNPGASGQKLPPAARDKSQFCGWHPAAIDKKQDEQTNHKKRGHRIRKHKNRPEPVEEFHYLFGPQLLFFLKKTAIEIFAKGEKFIHFGNFMYLHANMCNTSAQVEKWDILSKISFHFRKLNYYACILSLE
jgi:hypothetical protein